MRIKDVIESIDKGRIQTTSFRKISSQATTAGVWCDLSMASGNPSPNFYSGSELTSTVLDGNKGVYNGSGKYLFETLQYAGSANGAPLTLTLCDYLLFYPQIDMDSVDPQPMINNITLPRYESGEGVMMFVVAQYPYIGGADFTIKYTNSDGVSDRVTPLIKSNTALNIGSFIHGATNTSKSYGSFIPLQSGDKGVRSVEEITFSAPNGGLAALVLVKPLYTTIIRELQSPVEANTIINSGIFPEIKPNAYLNWIALPRASISGVPISGIIKTIW